MIKIVTIPLARPGVAVLLTHGAGLQSPMPCMPTCGSGLLVSTPTCPSQVQVAGMDSTVVKVFPLLSVPVSLVVVVLVTLLAARPALRRAVHIQPGLAQRYE